MYSDKDFNLVKPIFNKISKFSARQILDVCINKIGYAEDDPDRRYPQYPPWSLLLLIKWTLLYGTLEGQYPPKKFGETQLNALLNNLLNLDIEVEGKAASKRKHKDWFLYMRKKAFQEIPFQDPPHRARFARQSLIFGHLDPGDALRKRFVEQVSAEIEDVLELGFLVFARFRQERELFITENWFRNIADKYPPNTIRAFLQQLSKDFNSARQFLMESQTPYSPRLRYELTEMSPLKLFPLFRDGQNCYCYSPMLLYRSLEHYIYDTLRHSDPQAFGNDFGRRVFEQYVGRAVAHTELPLIYEKDVLNAFGQNGKLVDYIIVEGKSHIFIDAKAVEATYIGEVSEEPEHIIQRINSIIKGVDQAYSVAERLDGITHIGPVPLGKPAERYLLIVTYKDLYLGYGRDFYHYVAQDKLDEIAQQHGGKNWISFEHIFVVSVEDFDLLVQAVHQGQIGMSECLQRVASADSTALSDHRNLVFRWHLYQMIGNLDPPTYLDEEFEHLTARVRSKVP